MIQPLLTVCIPAYNRSGPLSRTLDVFKSEDPDSFLILVSDDSSTGDVEAAVRAYQGAMPNLLYHKNPENLGFSGNVSKLYELATTRYVWFLCDDDTVLPGAVPGILAGLRKHEPVVSVFNFSWDDSYGRRLVAGVEQDRAHEDRSAPGVYDVLMRLTFLSIIVMERRRPIDAITRNPAYKDNVFVQLTMGLLLLSDKMKLCEIAHPILHRNVGFKYGEFFKFYLLDPLKAVYLIPHAFENERFRRWMVANLWSAVQLYLSQKIGLFVYKGRPTRSTLQLLMCYYGPLGAVILTCRCLCALVPAPLIRAAYLLRLWRFHGFKNGLAAYRRLVDRAFTDERDTGFTTYR